jgi:hypothetical protein
MHLNRALDGISDKENIFWLQFKQRFASAKFPIILEQTLHESAYGDMKYISYDFEKFVPEMRNERFSREVSRGFYYFAKIKETEQYTALIYFERDEFMEDEGPILYKLVTYSPSGKIIDKRSIAGRAYFEEPLAISEITKDARVYLTNYKVVYSKDVDKHGYFDNPILELIELNQREFSINASGKIVEERMEELVQF